VLCNAHSSDPSPSRFASSQAFNALFVQLPPGTVEKLKNNVTAVANLLAYHLIPGAAAKAASLKNEEKLKTALKGKDLTVKLTSGGARSGPEIVAVGSRAKVVSADNLVCHGVVHVIDEVCAQCPLPDSHFTRSCAQVLLPIGGKMSSIGPRG
jgi:Fasciclin domain